MSKFPFNNFYEALEKNTKHNPNKKVIFSEEGDLKLKDLKSKVEHFAQYLISIGITQQDKVALITPNSSQFVIALFAITKIGAVAVPINTFLKQEEFEYILNNSDAKLLITSDEYKKELVDIQTSTKVEHLLLISEFETIYNTCYEKPSVVYQNSLDDVAIIIYTSGTTGFPKGAMLTYKNIISNASLAAKIMYVTPKDRFIVYLPMFHSFTLTIMVIAPILYNSSIVIVKSIFPFSNVLKQVLLKRVTIFLGAPQIYNALNKAKIPWYFMWFNKIRLFVSGAAPLSEQVFIDFKKKFKKAKMLEGYGLSECSPAVCVNPPEKQKNMSVGIPFEGYEVKIVDDELIEMPIGEVGELIVKGDCVMKGYYNNPEATDNTIINRWLKTGDLATVDEEGFIYIVDRKKDLIIAKGMNIYPREIEEILLTIEYIDNVAVIGVADENKDEKIVAFLELKEDIQKQDISVSEIKKYLKKHLANFKIPKEIYVIQELPKNATNKILKRKLKEDLEHYMNEGKIK